ncbi:Topoisomerase (DNA) II binding protein 1 [Aspergillus nanangensis]|uniref:Topoisomerase (DNA) II binding protein 1 n=1 Tax=Aspergillus nanangensis TaxID=2582783 RepID=A0AAD4GWX9_ASPNN|nr:Topoisomerase (DNA) II binding protein 1 [Aspergillus nanangensis]
MGATHRFDLTSDVTHLIVGETNTPKYKFVARERSDVAILKPEWIEAVRQSWMQGEDTDIHALGELHRLPTFEGLSICITGFEDMAFRNYIQNTASENGADFRKDLTKTVSHLIARTTEGQKYKFATQWNIKIVTLKWFTDSLERGMVLDETVYHPSLPAEKQGEGAWNRSTPVVRDKAPDNESSSSNPRPRKLRRIASAKLGDQNEGIWGDIVGSGFDNSELRRSRGSQQKDHNQATEKSVSIVQEPKSFASEIPYTLPRAKVPSTDDMAFECEVVTDMWLERCLDAKALVPPESHVANTPISGFPIKGFSGMKICSTGFSRIDLLHLSKLVSLIGGSYNEYLTPGASVLICNNSGLVNNEKLRHTSEWGVPAVSADWLWVCIRKQEKQPFEPYFVRKPSTQNSKDLEMRAGSRPEERAQSQNNPHNYIPDAHTQSPVHQKPPESKGNGELLERGSSTKSSTKARHDLQPLKEKPIIPQKQNPTPHSNTPPPAKDENANQPASILSPIKRKLSEQSATSTAQSIDLTISGFLKQAQAANSRPGSANDESNRARRRKPLLGRAPSHASIRAADQKGFSRASSIDTLNEDGCGSAFDSINTADGPTSLVNSGRFDLVDGDRPFEEEEAQAPPMTQLNYEDPDAVAMREKFLHHAGKLVEKKPPTDPALTMGRVQELENPGWGSGRRTRKSNKAVNDDLNEF